MNLFVFFRRHTVDMLSAAASLCFLAGSVLFLPVFTAYATLGVWLFATGSVILFVGSLLNMKFRP